MPGIFRTPLALVFVDEDNRELARVRDAPAVPRAGENVQLRGTPYVVDRIGWDVPGDEVERVLVVCRPV